MAAKFEVCNDKVGKFRFRLNTSNGTCTVRRGSVCLTASMLIGNGHDDRSPPSLLRALPLAVTACHPRACRHRRVELANRPGAVR
jgi:hypothetical protein